MRMYLGSRLHGGSVVEAAWLVLCGLVGYPSTTLVVWNPLCLDPPSDGVFGRFDLAAVCGCYTMFVVLCHADLF